MMPECTVQKKSIEKIPFRQHRDFGDATGQIILFIIASLILFVTANEQSLNIDEIGTVSRSDPRLGIFKIGFEDGQMPLTYVLVLICRVVFGSHDIVYRLPMLIFAIGTVMLIPKILRKEGVHRLTAWIAPYLILLLPTFIYYAQEVRAYMPMIFFILLWGIYRNVGGWREWILATLALQSNTFGLFYVVTVIVIDWGYAWWKKTENPSLSPIIAIGTHIPSILLFLHYNHLNPFSYVQGSGLRVGELLFRLFNIIPTINYLHKSFLFLFSGAVFVWGIILVVSLGCLLWRSTPFKRFLMGIGIAIMLCAHFIQIVGWKDIPRYLILLVPLLSISPFLIPWKRPLFSIGFAVLLVLSAHFTISPQWIGPLAYAEKGAHTEKSWQGIIPQLFSRTSAALIHSEREDWKHLTLLLKALAKPGDKVILQPLGWYYPFCLEFYDRTISANIRIHQSPDYWHFVGQKGDERVADPTSARYPASDCPDWIVSGRPLYAAGYKCGLTLVVRLDKLYVYGKKEMIIQEPLRVSRNLAY